MKKIILLLAGCLFFAASYAQEPVTFTAEQDHQNMLDQLGIKSIRRGFDADEKSPYAANYDESKANPFPVLPEILRTNAGKKVTTAKQWWEVRRPEIVEGFESEVYGRVPANVPGVTWTVEAEEIEMVGMMRAKAKQLRGHVDNSACPSIHVDIKMVVVTPANAKGPVPLLMMFGPANLPNPVKPGGEDMAVINKAIRQMLENNPETAELMKKYPAWQPFEPANPFAAFMRPSQQAPGQDPPSNQQLLAAGWGYAMIDPSSIQADNGAGLTRGIIGLTNHGQPRKPDDWGSLRAWAWGAARGLDYLETDPDVDAKHVGIEGVSRYPAPSYFRRRPGESLQCRRVPLDGRQLHQVLRNRVEDGRLERRHAAGGFPRTHRALRAAPGVHQLRYPGEGRRPVAGPVWQLAGDRGRR